MNEQNAAVQIQRDGAVAEIVLNRPEVLNAADLQLAEAFLAVCRSIAADPSVRIVVLRGAGKAFMGGGDLAGFRAAPERAAQTADALITPLNEAVTILAGLPVPVVASVHGAVAGAGVSLALACDLVIAADNAKFNLAYSRIGASPDLSASWFLPRVVGLQKAMEIALLAESFDAAEALRLGVVNRVVPASSLATETAALACRLAAGPAASYRAIKSLIRASYERDLRGQLEAERMAFCECARTHDFREGVAAFYERRAATFTGS
ncbi:enoyl-CoA hydratase-related protein [Paraburkholderia sp. BL10I2N1]|uniref:enoyl-CoA hydratase/isomerase family protein n=1 Tax=Paraburkholderia sp. BL10I2N1 TaxID=1938796 RepID=UPI00105E7B9C|nr:enoyl-CoA hydratase-related protein [Paraburkholderia sp. BL10I2N1]TDN61950.1 enoyl-CoA hydratase [Paraburkholderia sp. BL10I2N1]